MIARTIGTQRDNRGIDSMPGGGPASPGAADTPADIAPVPEVPFHAGRHVPAGRLFRKTFALILALVTAALLIPSSISLYVSWRETLDTLYELQREKAVAAAGRIEQYVLHVTTQIKGSALPQYGPDAPEQKRLALLTLLKQVPDVTDLAWIAPDGCEKVQVSRLALDAVGDCLRDRSHDPAFLEPTPARPWYGRVTFRKETEPYLPIAVRSGSSAGPVTVADVNLKFMWDVISRIKVGEQGKAYVVDAAGYLIADPDIGLVLRKTDLSGLAHVKAALAGIGIDEGRVVTSGADGARVLSAHAAIEPLGWKVFVEQPTAEAFARLDASIARVGFLLVGGLVISALAAWFLARGMTRPIRTLQEGAQLIGAGRLDHAIEVKTGDELEALAGQFNRMTSRLRESYAGLERKVAERTAELETALEQQTAISEILRVISASPTDLQPVMDAVAKHAAHLTGAPSAHVMLRDGDELRVKATYTRVGESPIPADFRVALDRTMITGRSVLEGATVHHADVVPLLDGEFSAAKENSLRFGFRAVLAVPLMRESAAYGTLFVWRPVPGEFSPDEVALLETFARQAAIAIDNVRLFNQTREALEQQQASAEVLSVISSSIADARPVFDRILESCERLFSGTRLGIMLVNDGKIEATTLRVGDREEWRKMWPRPLDRDTASGIAILDRRTVDFPDCDAPDFPSLAHTTGQMLDFRSVAAAPLIVEGQAIGALWVGRANKGELTPKQLELLSTFADQAVIAIRNANLFNETREALEQQTATAEVLRVIGSSVADTAPVFEKILDSCQQLFAGSQIGVFLLEDDGLVHAIAWRGPALEAIVAPFPRAVDDTVTGTVLRERRTFHIPDTAAMAEMPATVRDVVGRIGHFSCAWAPMMWEGRGVGSIAVLRQPPQAMSDKELALVKTFADQAVIAIQNARLFNETKEALDRQTATSEVLKTISRTAFELGPVLQTLIDSATRLCKADKGAIYLRREKGYELVAAHGADEEQLAFMRENVVAPGPGSVVGMVAHTGQVVHLDDARGNPEYTWREAQQKFGFRSIFGVPMVREGEPIGVLVMWRVEVRPFKPRERELVAMFADQGVIAIQNVRLLSETREALEQQQASGEVLAAISSSIADTAPVFDRILASCEKLFEGRVGLINLVDEGGLVRLAAYRGPARDELDRIYPFPVDERSATGRTILRRCVLHFADVEREPDVPEIALRAWRAMGARGLIVAPMLWEDRGIGSIVVARSHAGAFTAKEISLLRSFADQAAIAIQNARMVQEIRRKSRELEVASQHKSEFLANMSHELRTPLNAVIGFSEVLLERMFGEVNAKQEDYLKDILSSGRHLLSLINDILDLSKVEAGRMELEPSRFEVAAAVHNAMTLVRERAQRHGIALGAELAPDLGEVVADERKFKQILLNLLTNAVKFTPDGGRVDVSARRGADALEVAVRDTGIGIAREDQQAVFEEFRQVGRHYTNKQEGTGLGLALTRRFVELHGGAVRLESVPGKGSTFTFTIPVRA